MSLQSIWIKNFFLPLYCCGEEELSCRHVYFYFLSNVKRRKNTIETKRIKGKEGNISFLCALEEFEGCFDSFRVVICMCAIKKENFNVKLGWLMEIDFSVYGWKIVAWKSPATIYDEIFLKKGLNMNHTQTLTHALNV